MFQILVFKQGQYHRSLRFHTKAQMLRVAKCYNNSPHFKALVTY